MINHTLTIELTNTGWQSDWNGCEVGFPEVEIVGLYTQRRDDGVYNFYIDIINGKVIDFWKDEEEEDYESVFV